jgi:predicted Fe-Mo cluster-binding NifX family protein
MKIAAVTDDGITISQHFGRATQYAVLTVEDGKIVTRELRSKLGHMHFAGQEEPHEAPGTPHGMGADAQVRHGQMIDAITDCQVLMARGMGQGAKYSLEQAGIKAILTDIEGIDAAVQAYLGGKIVDHTELLH